MEKDIYWNEKSYKDYINYLKSIRSEDYKKFQMKLIDTKYEILGVKLPILRKIAQEIKKGDYQSFLNLCENNYYEEVMLQGFIIASIKDFEELMFYFARFLDLIDNWSITDSFCCSLKIVKKNKDKFLNIIDILISSKETFKIRVGLVLLLNYYVEAFYLSLIFTYLDNLDSEEYYVNMAASWLLCECFIKEEELTLNYLDNHKLNKFTINKAISKIRDSYRVSTEMKEYIIKYRK